jgi:hypothetical protein
VNENIEYAGANHFNKNRGGTIHFRTHASWHYNRKKSDNQILSHGTSGLTRVMMGLIFYHNTKTPEIFY